VNASQTKALYAGMGFAVAAIAFAATGTWLLALSFAVLAVSYIANWTRNRSKLEA
jgi:hypothetical protein